MRSRQPDPVTPGGLAETMDAALKIAIQMRADGATQAEIDAGLEQTLRVAWPHRDIPWRHDCESCEDIGVAILQCPGDATCGKRHREHPPHSYVDVTRPCWCPAGNYWRGKPKTEESAVEAAAKTSKPKGFTRFGR